MILVCKYRKKLLIKYGDDVKTMFEEIASSSDFSIEQMEVDKDHIHILVRSKPKPSPFSLVRKLKQESTIRLWKSYEKELKVHFWKERTFWSDGYFCSSIGNARQETIRHYIENQG